MPKGVYEHRKGYKRPPFSQEWKDRISAGKKKAPVRYWLDKKRSGIGTGRKHSDESRVKMRDAKIGVTPWNKGLVGFRAGEQSHLWRGGVTPVNLKIRGSVEYREWRKSVFVRDNYTCVWCGAKSGKGEPVKLNADHIKPFALYAELRFDINNGRTLCVPCHRKTDTYGEKTKKLMKELGIIKTQ